MLGNEADESPSEKGGFEVFLGIVGEACAAGMSAAGMNAALDLDQNAGGLDGEVSAPFSGWVELEFLGDGNWPAGSLPEEKEVGFRVAHGMEVRQFGQAGS